MKFRIRREILATLLAVLPLVLMFTAAGAAGSDVFDQCQTGEPPTGTCNWIGSILNANANTYFEGMATPQRILFRGIDTTVLTRTIQFQFQWTKGGKHAYDWPVTWAQAETLAQSIGHYTLNIGNPCANVGGAAANQTACNSVNITQTIPFPGDPYVSGSFGLPATNGNTNDRIAAFSAVYGTPGVQLITTAGVAATFRTPVHSVPNGADSADSLVTYTLDITRTGASFPATILLLFAAHISISDAPGDPSAPLTTWGQQSGAKMISGAPYHVKDPCILPGGSCPNEDNQLAMDGTPLTPALVTRISGSTISLASSVSDTVTMTLSASSVLSGFLRFYICGPALAINPCLPQYVTKTLVSTHNISTTADTVVRSSSNYLPASVGYWCFLTQWINQDYSTQSWEDFSTTDECVQVVTTTAVKFSKASASPDAFGTVTLRWTTASEVNTAGFNVYRGETRNGPFTRLNGQLLPASPDALSGRRYEYRDHSAIAERTYYYQLEDVELDGTTHRHPPIRVETGAPAAIEWGVPAGSLALMGLLGGALVRRRNARRG